MKKIVHSPAPLNTVKQASHSVELFLAILIILLWPFQRRLSRRKNVPATDKQIEYLKILIAQKNFYRSKPVIFEDWMEKKRFMSIWSASKLIDNIKSENKALKAEFNLLKKNNRARSYREELFVSDLRTFRFANVLLFTQPISISAKT
ncbi:MAG: hypothetical protein ACXVCA_19455 [Bdellovibrio sp.]